MNQSITIKTLPLLMAALLFAGCSSTPTQQASDAVEVSDQSIDADAEEQLVDDAADTMGAIDEDEWSGSPLENPASLLSTRVIYFELDRSEIQSEFREVIRAHADYLATTPSAQVMLEGHGDERGTREYNLALGERRAKSVRMLLVAEGAPSDQITIISYGEERPASDLHYEAGWSLNRRVELVY